MFIHLIWIYEKHEMLVFHTDLHLPLNFTYWGKQEENKTKINKWIHKWTIHICDYRRKEMYFPVWKYFTLSIWNPKGCINIGIISIYNLYRNMCSWGHLFRLVYHSCFFKRKHFASDPMVKKYQRTQGYMSQISWNYPFPKQVFSLVWSQLICFALITYCWKVWHQL